MIDISDYTINKKLKILTMECDNISLLVLKNILEPQYMVININSYEETKRYIENNKIDLLIADVTKYEDGFSSHVIELINSSLNIYKFIPVIVISKIFSAETEKKYFEYGVSDCILKSSHSDILFEKIKKTIRHGKYYNELEKIINSQAEEIAQLQNNTLTCFADLIDRRDMTTGGHVKRTQIYVEYLIAKIDESTKYKDAFSPEEKAIICSSAVLHDIGKITIPDSILCKQDKLTDEEFKKMRNHTIEGAKIIEQNLSSIFSNENHIRIASNIAKYHHEKWNGNGYPKGLEKEEIPLCARIMSIADVFDALTSKRHYKDPINFEETVEKMKEEKNISFDPDLLNIFFSNEEELKELMLTIINLGY